MCIARAPEAGRQERGRGEQGDTRDVGMFKGIRRGGWGGGACEVVVMVDVVKVGCGGETPQRERTGISARSVNAWRSMDRGTEGEGLGWVLSREEAPAEIVETASVCTSRRHDGSMPYRGGRWA